ncbi:unnamed protein product [Larinioides sclopetarius]|uniref:Nuclear envelope membrane protein n=1 Tax=Larinioides sclopetarius TaxID=280406 RepID=A0AAV2AUF5_9ARAC
MSFKDNVAILTALCVLLCCIFTLGQLVLFLSSHTSLKQNRYPPFVYFGHFECLWLQVLANVCLVGFFILQHSLQNHPSVKHFLNSRGLGVFERLFYNLGSCLALQALMQLWHATPGWVVWHVSTSDHPVAWWIFAGLHCVAWLFIYGGCYVMDITELLGARQVIYSLQGVPDPMSLKSDGLRRMYSHMRHPSFSAVTVLLFFHPVMQLDRLLLAHALLLYFLLGTRVDDVDYCYQLRMLQRKERDLG